MCQDYDRIVEGNQSYARDSQLKSDHRPKAEIGANQTNKVTKDESDSSEEEPIHLVCVT